LLQFAGGFNSGRKKIFVLMNIGARPVKIMLIHPLAKANGKGYSFE
jgi:hypothetical protein